MSFTDDFLNSDWKESKIKLIKIIKQESNKPKYSQKFCEKWTKLFEPWLARCEDDPNKPFCRACQCRLDSNRCHLQRHERTTKHARNLEILINKGESAARQNLSIRQERSKYYQQRKKMSTTLAYAHETTSNMTFDTAEDYIEETDADGETYFQFVQTEGTSGDQYNDEILLKQETTSADETVDHLQPTPVSLAKSSITHADRTHLQKRGVKKERMKLLMQIQKDKNDLMDSFKDLMGGALLQSPKREKNHVDLFFESVSSSVKALSPKLVAEAKMRVSQLICELELRALTESDANTSTGIGTGSAAVVVSSDVSASSAYILNTPVSAVVQTTALNPEEAPEEFEALS